MNGKYLYARWVGCNSHDDVVDSTPTICLKQKIQGQMSSTLIHSFILCLLQFVCGVFVELIKAFESREKKREEVEFEFKLCQLISSSSSSPFLLNEMNSLHRYGWN